MTLRVYTDSNVRPEPWMKRAECATTDPDVFFPDMGDWRGTQTAIKVCNGCDVAAQCLAFAMRTDQREGVWGGLSGKARQRLRRMRNAA